MFQLHLPYYLVHSFVGNICHWVREVVPIHHDYLVCTVYFCRMNRMVVGNFDKILDIVSDVTLKH